MSRRCYGEALVLVFTAMMLLATGWVLTREIKAKVVEQPKIQVIATPSVQAAPRKTTLADVQRDWGIQGRLNCKAE